MSTSLAAAVLLLHASAMASKTAAWTPVCGVFERRPNPPLPSPRGAVPAARPGSLRPPPPKIPSSQSRRGLLAGAAAASAATLAAATASAALPPRPALAAAAAATAPPPAAAPSAARAEFYSGLASGAVQRVVKDCVLHPIDTVRCRVSLAPPGRRSLFNATLYEDPYAGVGASLLAGVPAGAVFFGSKDALRAALAESGALPRQASTVACVAAALLPYWAVRCPGELAKTRLQAGQKVEWRALSRDGLWRGFGANWAYSFPVDVVKFLVFDALKQTVPGGKFSPAAGAAAGAAASCVSQLVGAPLDVGRTRLLAAPRGRYPGGILDAVRTTARDEGPGTLYSALAPALARSTVSGAVQFGTLVASKSFFGGEA